MKVKELIQELQLCDPEGIVVMSKDSEGNCYSPLSDCWKGVYAAETTWYGEVGLRTLTEADRASGYTEEDVLKGESAVILCPVN